MIILAQVGPDMSKQIGWWLVSFGAVCFIVNQALEFFRKVKGKSAQPPNEQLQESHHELARRVNTIETDLAIIRSEMKNDYNANQIHASARSKTLFDAVADSRQELRDEIQSVREMVSDLQTNMPNQIVTLLKNTGAI